MTSSEEKSDSEDSQEAGTPDEADLPGGRGDALAWSMDRSSVSRKELIGRRTFGADDKIFSSVDPLEYRIDVFIDPNLDKDLSFDRLGVREVNQAACRQLSPVGRAHGQRLKPVREFRGWAVIMMADLKDKVAPTSAVGETNPYHAELSRKPYPNKFAARALAFMLCMLARKHPHVKPVP